MATIITMFHPNNAIIIISIIIIHQLLQLTTAAHFNIILTRVYLNDDGVTRAVNLEN